MRHVLTFIAVAVILVALEGCSDEQPQPPVEAKQPAEPAPDRELDSFKKPKRLWRTVRRVIDGRTIELRGGEKVRLIGVAGAVDFVQDTPIEKKEIEFIQKKLQGKKVWLEYDKEGVLHRDKRFRTLAYVHYTVKGHGWVRVPSGDGTENLRMPFERDYVLNEEIVLLGYRPVDRDYDFRHKKKYVELERKARKEQRGCWKPEAGLPSGTPYERHDFPSEQEEVSGPEVYVTKSDRKYHTYECLDLFGVRFEWVLLKDAKKQGYTPCEKCNPPAGE
jgi:endonuclease YncB( thermonuclease family)